MLYNEYQLHKRAYQEFGAIFLLERKHACLYYKPGKGKTYPTIDAMREVDKEKKGNAKVLVLSTADAIKKMWETEILPQNILPKNTILMSFNSAIINDTRIKLLSIKWDIIVVDECHKVKAHNTKTSKLVYQLAKHTEYVWGLSGTPRGNSDIDIFCQFHNLCVDAWGEISYTQFIQQCCDVEPQFFGGQRIMRPMGITKRYRAGWDTNVAMNTQRIDYDELDDMPNLNVNIVDFSYVPTKEYKDAEIGIMQLSDYETTMTKLAAITKMHQAVNGFLYYEEDGKQKVHHIAYNTKLDYVVKHIEQPTVIVYRFVEDLECLKQKLPKNCWTEDITDFKDKKYNVLLLQCSRCESFNLQMCQHIIFYTLDYSYIKYDQMIHRVWRMGQTLPVQIDVLLFKDTIETKIWHAVSNKQKLADLFMAIKGV